MKKSCISILITQNFWIIIFTFNRFFFAKSMLTKNWPKVFLKWDQWQTEKLENMTFGSLHARICFQTWRANLINWHFFFDKNIFCIINFGKKVNYLSWVNIICFQFLSINNTFDKILSRLFCKYLQSSYHKTNIAFTFIALKISSKKKR